MEEAIAGGGEVAGQGRAGHVGEAFGEGVTHHRDDALGPAGDERGSENILARQQQKVFGFAGRDVQALLHVAAGFLDADDIGVLGQAQRRLRSEVGSGAAGHIVENQGDGAGLGQAVVVGDNAGLAGLVVGGASRKHCGHSRQVGAGEKGFGGGRIVAANAVHQGHPPGNVLFGHAQQLGFFGRAGGGRFAGGAIHHEVFHAAVDAEIEQPPPAGVVHREIGGEWGDQGHARAMKYR